MQFLIPTIGPAPSEDPEAFRARLTTERSRTLAGLHASAAQAAAIAERKTKRTKKTAKPSAKVAGYDRSFVENLAQSTGRSFEETVAFLKEHG